MVFRINLKAIVIVVLFFLCQLPQAFCAELPHVFVPIGGQRQPLATQLEYLEDSNGTYTVDQVASGKAGEFRLLQKTNFGFGYKHVLWIRFSVDLKGYREPYWFLTHGYEHVGHLTLFHSTKAGFQEIKISEEVAADKRAFNIHTYLFKIPTPETSPQTYYMRFDPQGHALSVDLSWASLKGIIEYIHDIQLLYGLLFGGLLIMWFYNFVLFVFLRSRDYAYYIYYLGCFIAAFFYLNGFVPLLVASTTFYEQLFAAFAYGAAHGMTLFGRHFLSLATSIRWLDIYLRTCQWLMAVGGIATFFLPVGIPYPILNGLIVLTVPFLLVAGLFRWLRHGYAPAGLYSLGWIIFGISLIIYCLRLVGFLPVNWITNYAIQGASVWEAALFALALARRIKLIEKEKEELLKGEKARLEERVAERTQALQTLLETRRLMVANASHELRTPVNALRLLIDSSLGNANDKQVIPRVKDIAEHMSQLVETLLLLDPDRPMTSAPGLVDDFDLGREIRATANLVVPLRHGSLATFTIDVDQCLGVMVSGDRSALRRILINLLSNAFTFTQEGAVSLLAKVDCNAEQGTRQCTIRVTDTGKGIAAPMREQIFDPFVTTGIHDGHTGTGLGLAISRQLAQRLGGSLSLISLEVNNGSVFECVVPFEPASEKGDEKAMPSTALSKPYAVGQQRRLRVLLAEDDPMTADVVQLVIRRLRHDVVHVATYDQLYRALHDTSPPFDFALIDQRLPGGNGLDVIKICREREIATSTRMVLLTADATPEVLTSAKAICDDTITKPTTAYRIRQLLGGDNTEPLTDMSATSNGIMDPNPLKTLLQCGATHATLTRMVESFVATVDNILEQIKTLVPTLSSSTTPEHLREVVHRVRSSCTTLGAVALDKEFLALAACMDSTTAEQQLSRITQTFYATQEALTIFLSGIEIDGQHQHL